MSGEIVRHGPDAGKRSVENTGPGQPSAYYERLSRDGDFENRLAARVAWRLERTIRERALCGGALMGTERTLANDLDVSRATVREALHILEIRGAVRVDRGNGGGIRVTVPEFRAVAKVLGRYFCSRGASAREFGEAATILNALACDADVGDAGPVFHLLAELVAASRPEHFPGADALGGIDSHSRARLLAAALLDEAKGEIRIGSEWQICERFAVDRRIARQAVRILQENGLAKPLRGRGGGIEAMAPLPGTVLRATYSFFAGRHLGVVPSNLAIEHLNISIVRLAATRRTEEDEARFAFSVGKTSPVGADMALMEVMEAIFGAAGNIVLVTAQRCLLAYVARGFPEICVVPAVLAEDFGLSYAAVGRAVGAGDEAAAVDAQRAFHAVLHRVSAHLDEAAASQI